MSDQTKEKDGSGEVTFPIADVESCSWYEAMVADPEIAEEEITPFDTPVSIHIHSKRKRLTDADSVSAKAAIDGLVHAGLLQDDSPEFVQEVSYSQEKTEKDDPEETILTIKEI